MRNDEAQLKAAADAVAKHGSKAAAARALGVAVTTLKGRYAKAVELGLASSNGDDKTGERYEVNTNGDQMHVHSVAHDVTTVEDALLKGGVDRMVWEVDRFTLNSWEVVGGEMGRHPLWQVKVWLKRRVAAVYQDVAKELAAEIAKHAPKYTRVTRKVTTDPHMLEVSLFDAHFGKLAWEPETGDTYDLKIAEQVYADAVDTLLANSGKLGVEIDKVIYPIGQDFFHVNNREGTTPKNQNQLDFDTRLHKIFKAGCRAVINSVHRCLDVAPVELLWVPGNHDPDTSWFMFQNVAAAFANHPDVIADDDDSRHRKYVHYGVNLIGFTHGDEEPHKALPTIMMSERPDECAKSTHKEWHLGHFHKRKQTEFLSCDSFGSVTVRVLPSLSGTDGWHYRKGYVGGMRAAEAYLWSKSNGYTGHLSANRN
jgi:hypothetical protein